MHDGKKVLEEIAFEIGYWHCNSCYPQAMDLEKEAIAAKVYALARNEALEEAADTAAKHGNVEWEDGDGGQYGYGFETACDEIAAAIRALKT